MTDGHDVEGEPFDTDSHVAVYDQARQKLDLPGDTAYTLTMDVSHPIEDTDEAMLICECGEPFRRYDGWWEHINGEYQDVREAEDNGVAAVVRERDTMQLTDFEELTDKDGGGSA